MTVAYLSATRSPGSVHHSAGLNSSRQPGIARPVRLRNPAYRTVSSTAETHIGLFKDECIRPDGPWRDVNHVEKGTFEWVTWFNTERTREAIDDLTPIEAEEFYYAHHTGLAEAG
jgi:transposase InsO family protein